MGKLSIERLDSINSTVIKYCLSKGLKIDVVTFCPHHPHKGFENEISILKGLFLQETKSRNDFRTVFLRNINLGNSLMIGDSVDLKAAGNSGCKFINVRIYEILFLDKFK